MIAVKVWKIIMTLYLKYFKKCDHFREIMQYKRYRTFKIEMSSDKIQDDSPSEFPHFSFINELI